MKCALFAFCSAMPLLKEGLSWSPYPVVHVRKYIDAIYNERKKPTDHNDAGATQTSKYWELIEIYSQIKSPVFMAVDEDDYTVSTPVSLEVFRKLSAKKNLIFYSNSEQIAHANITTYSDDTYRYSPEFFNHQTSQLKDRMTEFMQNTIQKRQ